MHLTYPVFYALSHWMNATLVGSRLLDAFTQEKDELMLEFSTGTYLRIQCGAAQQFVVPVSAFSRTNQNSVSLFPEIHRKLLLRTEVLKDDRVIKMEFEDAFCLWLKMFGNRSNVLLTSKGSFQNSFLKKKGEEDWIQQVQNKPVQVLSVPPAWTRHPDLIALNYPLHTEEERIAFLRIASGPVWGYSEVEKPEIILQLPEGKPIQEALEAWIRIRLSRDAFNQEYQGLVSSLTSHLGYLNSSVHALDKAISQMKHEREEEELGHLILANLHLISPEDEVLSCVDAYSGKPIQIPLKKNLSPAAQADWYYRKSRNRKAELERCQNQQEEIRLKLPSVERALEALQKVQSLSDLRQWKKAHAQWIQPNRAKSTEEKSLPWKEFQIQDWIIRVGKDARSNDQLTLKGSKPGDLWLHVKDYSGSHVIIRQKHGVTYPEELIQKAAGLAVWFSPRRNHELVAVSVCDRKHVRKNKKMPPGAVTLERYQTILVNSPAQLKDLL